MAEEGVKVVVNDLDNHPRIGAVARETGGIALTCDISDAARVDKMVNEIENLYISIKQYQEDKK